MLMNPIRRRLGAVAAAVTVLATTTSTFASEDSLILPDLSSVHFMGVPGRTLLMWGLLVCVAGLAFGLFFYQRLRNLPVHKSMLEVSELIYETCKTYLKTQGKFILLLWVFIAVIMVAYFGFLTGHASPTVPPAGTDTPAGVVVHAPDNISTPMKVAIILFFSLVGIAGSYSVAWFGIRINTFANSRTAMGALAGKAFPCYAIPLQARMSIGMVLISVELILMLIILLFVPPTVAGSCFIGFAIGESLGAAALRVAGGIFTKIADIGADLMKIVFNVKEDDARNPGGIPDWTGDNARDGRGPSPD